MSNQSAPHNNSNSSSKQDPATNSGESMQQGKDDIVNDQLQNKSVNQEEFVDDASPNIPVGKTNKVEEGMEDVSDNNEVIPGTDSDVEK